MQHADSGVNHHLNLPCDLQYFASHLQKKKATQQFIYHPLHSLNQLAIFNN